MNKGETLVSMNKGEIIKERSWLALAALANVGCGNERTNVISLLALSRAVAPKMSVAIVNV